MNTLESFLMTWLDLWLDSAFWIIIGLIVAGVLKSLMNTNKLGFLFKGAGLWPAVKATVLGAPLPLCSCGVIPAALGMRRSGASKSSTVAFLISTPETGVDSISISYALLGPFMAIIRPIAAMSSAIVAAILVLFTDKETPTNTEVKSNKNDCSSSCCSTKSVQNTEASWAKRLWKGQLFAFTELIADLSIWLIIGLTASALVVTFIPPEALADISRGPWAMLIMALIGVPMYICASASTPLAAGFMLAGVSPGAVLVFLLAGPATNMATLGIVYNQLGKRVLASYLTGVIGVALMFGYLTNLLVDELSIDIQTQLASNNHFIPDSIVWISAIALVMLIIRDLYLRMKNMLMKPIYS
ncbi:SO_0444 family Cu/Zn efflux transporter [Vibrio astriarenae]|uniref:SO_0444 family Cu/Zn efflux transporter n=1 Tax=Vibrio astriarenae TaxID=1481923 RepID=UPI003734E9B6